MTRTMRVSKISLSDNQTASVELDVVVDGKKTYGGYLVLNNLPLDHAYAIGQDYEISVTRARKEVPSVA